MEINRITPTQNTYRVTPINHAERSQNNQSPYNTTKELSNSEALSSFTQKIQTYWSSLKQNTPKKFKSDLKISTNLEVSEYGRTTLYKISAEAIDISHVFAKYKDATNRIHKKAQDGKFEPAEEKLDFIKDISRRLTKKEIPNRIKDLEIKIENPLNQ